MLARRSRARLAAVAVALMTAALLAAAPLSAASAAPVATSEPAPAPAPVSATSSEPTADATVDPAGDPEPEPTSAPEPTAEPEPTPEITPSPEPAPTPTPTAVPTPTPDPTPAPATGLEPLPASAWVATGSAASGTVLVQTDPAGVDYGVDLTWAPRADQAASVLRYRLELYSGRTTSNANSLIARVELPAGTTRYRVDGVGFGSTTVTAKVTAFDGAEALADPLESEPVTLPASSTGVLGTARAGVPELSAPTEHGFTVTWQPAVSTAGEPAPAGYAVRVLERRHDQLATSASSFVVATYDAGTRTAAALTGLEGSSRYLAAVVAYDVVDGVKRFRPSSAVSAVPAWSSDYAAQTLGARAPAAEFSNRPATPVASSARVITWQGAATTGRYTGGSPITGYRVELHRAGAGLVETAEVAAGDSPTATFRGLESGARYSVRVAAVNAEGVGELSDFSPAVTTPGGSTPGSRTPAYPDRAAVAAAVAAGSLASTGTGTGPGPGTAALTVEQGSDLTVATPWAASATPVTGEAWWYGDATFAASVTGGGPAGRTTASTLTLPTTGLPTGTHYLLFVSDAELDGLTPPAAAAALAVVVEIVPSTSAALTLENAVLRWGLNDESNNGAYFGGCNFFSAGLTPDPGGSVLFGPAQYAASAGSVSIQKPDASGAYVPASWDTKCLDRTGAPLSSGTATPYGGNQFVITGGTGELDRATGSGTIRWDGDVTVVYYGGLTFWYLSDPVLTVQNGVGTLTATGSGFGTDMDDLTKWQPIAPRTITLATFEGAQLGAEGFTISPDYRGVTVELPAGAAAQARTGDDWGSFPQSFVDFQGETGQAAYWYSSGGQADAAKPAQAFTVGYDAATFAPPAAPAVAAEQVGARSPSVKLPPARLPVLAAASAAAPAPLASSATTAGAAGTVTIVQSASAPLLSPTVVVLLLALLAALGLVVVVAGAGGGFVVLGLTQRN